MAIGSAPDCDAENVNPDWPVARWGRILDRVELRQAGLGLKFWGPPLWLEVTMTGPDSDRWPANPEGNDSWNWLSTETCSEAERLFDRGADDDQLVVAVGRYTVENLILNAVHEIGEWLRFDGQRVFPAHLSAEASATAADGQGNGSVQLTVTFRPPLRPTPAFRAQSRVRQWRDTGRLREFSIVDFGLRNDCGFWIDGFGIGLLIRGFCTMPKCNPQIQNRKSAIILQSPIDNHQ